ncbi:MAG: nucleotidyl transferase AbiEii/AbiGii toxin family protein [Candidatus Atribacteria bacterium]|nr:MAG: nucleotidyl transferase AbiEii/AbiGii toxin family protein [Candidatus Atribacteria bacterium]
MEKEVKNKAASVRAKLMNIARAEKIDFDFLLLRYFQERFLYRLAISEFSDRFILKGGLLLICLRMPRSRPTKDIDFLAKEIKNDPVKLGHIFRSITAISYNDGVIFNSSSLISEQIKENADYEGIRIKIDATLGQARKKLQMDIGFGDVIIPRAMRMEFPTLLEEKPPRIKVYSIESIISEKFEAMVKLAMVNSRMKDFYDIYTLSVSYNFQSDRLKKAIESTFYRRKTSIPDNPLIFRLKFHRDEEKQRQWSAFLRKSRLQDVNQDFNEIIERITSFLKPIVVSIKDKNKENKIWDAIAGCWKK